MTVLIGFSFPDLTVIGADGRGIAHHDRNDVVDDMLKIYRTGFGLMAGAGRTDVIEAVTNLFAGFTPGPTDDAAQIIRCRITSLGLADNDPAIARTCWLASYLTGTPAGPQCQLALVNQDTNYNPGIFPHEHAVVIEPFGMDTEAARSVRARAQARLDGEMRGRPLLERLGLCVNLIGEIVTSVAALNDSVGPWWAVGYHDGQNRVRVSNVAARAERALSMTLRHQG